MTARIDAHHHVWDPTVRDQPWLDTAPMAPLRRRFGIEELVADVAASHISGTIVVQSIAEIAETEELLDLADAERLLIGVIGYADVAAPDAGEQLDRLMDRPSGRWLAGIRSLVQDEPDPDWLLRPGVLAGLRHIASRELTYDLLIRPHQLGAARGAVASVPECRFVVDHLAKPAIARGEWEPWAAGITALARHPNVSAKLSGMVTEADWTTWTTDELRPYVDHALSAFGPDRLMFGSDWPVCTLAAPYGRVVAVVEELLDTLSNDERSAVLGGTAMDVYRRPVP